MTGGPRDRPIADGDLLVIDTDTTFDGYFCDYYRNCQVGRATDALWYAQEKVWEAHEIGLKAATAGYGRRICFEQMAKALSSGGESCGADSTATGAWGMVLGCG
ncbi:M24 family metallopeptidase [Mesorhizobium sp. M1005]|uniref:M24 family metallopeptidase n=1 Tax=unclassified Mesorhizobium TaxID=325217 RepID=UPI0033387098